MAFKREKNRKQTMIVYTLITVAVLCAVFLSMVSYLYTSAKAEAYENLHVQTKQIKDDIHLQMMSDRENLATMANFAAKLYSDGEGYELMFSSFKPIGLIANIGILNADGTFATKAGTIDLNGHISFEEEAAKGAYISGRIEDITKDGYELIRSAVPIVANGKTVGILYGVIKPEALGEKYAAMVQDLNAQLFVYEKSSGDLVIDTVHTTLGNISFLKDRVYDDGYSYEAILNSEKGFTSFASAYKDENLHLHYSTIDDIGWMIALGRYDNQVFATTHKLTQVLFLCFVGMLLAIAAYIFVVLRGERRANAIANCASDVRKELLETIGRQDNIRDALKVFTAFTKAEMMLVYDDKGADFSYLPNEDSPLKIVKTERRHLKSVLSGYAARLHRESASPLDILCVRADAALKKNNPDFYAFMQKHAITEISLAAVTDNTNNVTVLCALNPKHGKDARILAGRVAACFSMALYNKKQLEDTESIATTDALTSLLNTTAYKADVKELDAQKVKDMYCVYVDVNGLHMCNNLNGHSAGDVMLRYVADSLTAVFTNHAIYRVGGDEFLVLAKGVAREEIEQGVQRFREKLAEGKYSASIGVSYREENTDTEDAVKEAEEGMYKEKSAYYQDKQEKSFVSSDSYEFVQAKTGILEIDTVLSVLKENYNGIYRVSLDTDKVHGILMPTYLQYDEYEEHFSKLFLKYAAEMVAPDYHRHLSDLAHDDYSSLKYQLSQGETPKVSYEKVNGEKMVLSVYKLDQTENDDFETLWVFAKE